MAPVPRGLAAREGVLGEGGEAGVDHPLHLGVGLEPGGDFEGGRGLRLHPHRQGLAPLEGKPRHEGRHDAAGRVLDEAYRLRLLRRRAHHRAPHRRVVSVQVLGGGVHHEVRAKPEGALVPGGEQRVVDNVEDAAGAGDFGDGRDVGELEGGVGRGLGEDEPGLAAHARLHRGGVRGVGERELHPEAGEDLPAQAQRPAEDHVRHDRVVARVQERDEDGVDRGHAGAERGGVRSPLERGELRFQRPHGRVVRARVGVALRPILVDGRLHVGRRLVDGGEDRPRRRVGRDPRMHLPGREAVVRPVPPAHRLRLPPGASPSALSSAVRARGRSMVARRARRPDGHALTGGFE